MTILAIVIIATQILCSGDNIVTLYTYLPTDKKEFTNSHMYDV